MVKIHYYLIGLLEFCKYQMRSSGTRSEKADLKKMIKKERQHLRTHTNNYLISGDLRQFTLGIASEDSRKVDSTLGSQ